MDKRRTFGILQPISALPSGEGIGTFGAGAYRFVDFLKQAGAGIWQVLPLVPTNYGDSPYQSCSASALNYYFIDLEMLAEEGLLTKAEIAAADLGDSDRRIDYGKQFRNKLSVLRLAFSRFDCQKDDFAAFLDSGKYEDFAVFMGLKCHHAHRAWTEWEDRYRFYHASAIAEFCSTDREEILFWQFTQYYALRQWKALKAYANASGIRIMGDTPLYLAYDSVEMWKYGDQLFQVDAERRPSCVAGVPPDAFSEDGQLWGNPLYDWQKMQQDGYRWWDARLKDNFELFDILRIDHFRGLDRYYSIPVGEVTAKNGCWKDGPAEKLFEGKLDWSIVAEDLGIIDDGVRRMMGALGYPGMKVLEFAFDGSEWNDHKPRFHSTNTVCYTGTHDNMPLMQYLQELPPEALEICKRDIRRECELLGIRPQLGTPERICHTIVRMAFYSPAFAAILPLSDLLAMGKEARINFPSTVSSDNWSFRFKEEEFSPALAASLRRLARLTGRSL